MFFCAFADTAWHVTTPDERREALRSSGEETGSWVIVAETEKRRYSPGSGVWWDVAVAEVTNDPVTQELRAKYEEERKRLQGSIIEQLPIRGGK